MDPVTAAGIGLSVTSLTLQLFSGCIKGYQLLLDVADMPIKLEHIRVRMRLEQIRLLNWGDQVGLLEDMLEEPSSVLQLHRNLIFDILLEISRLFNTCFRIDAKFTTSSSKTSSDITTIAPLLIEGKNPMTKRGTNLLARAINLSLRSVELPKRLEWAMIKQDKFETLVEKLISYNDSITSLLDRSSLQQVQQAQMQANLLLLNLSTKIDDLTFLTQAMHINPTRDIQTTLLPQAQIYPRIRSEENDASLLYSNSTLLRLATFKSNRLSIEQDSSSVNEILIKRDEVYDLGNHSGIDIASYHNQKVWIEWKDSDQRHPNPFWKSLLDIRVKKLASLLSVPDVPRELRIPKCLGYFEEVEDDDTVHYGFVHQHPADASEAATPRTLHDLVRNRPIPSLTKRIQLAVALTSSILYLHSVNWLHKGIRSENVVFFAQEEAMINYTSPILKGFEYARPDQPEEVTEKPQSIPEHDIYRHPNSLLSHNTRSKKSWDIYSLGVVLVEIALWKSIKEIACIDFRNTAAKSKIRRVRDLLLQDKVLETVGAQCGDRYREAVKLCITDRPDSSYDMNGTHLEAEAGLLEAELVSQDVLNVLQSIQT